MSKCRGCGITLQSDNNLNIGFIPKEKIKEKLCLRCFQMTHYNKNQEVDIIDNQKIINKINENNILVFFLIDFLNINHETINTFKNIKNNKYLVISKFDYLPKYLNKEKIIYWLKNIYKIKEEIIFISSKKKYNLNKIFNILDKFNNICYLVGYTNAGKSSLINTLTNNNLTTSYYPNTTLDFLKIKFDKYTFIDTPGLRYTNYYNDLNKKINIKNIIKPITYQLKKNTSLIIEDKIKITNLSDKTNLTIYLSNMLNIKKVYENNKSLENLENFSLDVNINEDIVLKSIGFITFKTNSKITIYLNNKNLIEKRESVFGSYE